MPSSTSTDRTEADPRASEGPPALRIHGVSKAFGGTAALDEVSFEIRRGAVHALLGGNGSGKSTLIKILAGVYQGDAGWVEVDGERVDASRTHPDWAHSAGMHFVHQGVGTFPELSVAENFALGSTYGSRSLARVRWRSLHRRVDEVLERFEIAVDSRRRMGDLSAATQTMIAIARALQDQEDAGRGLLVLDEPTAALPADESAVLLDAVRGYVQRGHTVVLVTHRLEEVLAVCSDATFLRDGRHLETRDVQSLDERALVQRIAGMTHLRTIVHEHDTGADVRVKVEGLEAGPLRSVSFDVRVGEVVGLSGLLGSGRSSLLRALFGAGQGRGGTVTIDGERLAATHPAEAMAMGVAYVPEDRTAEAVFAARSVRENLAVPDLSRYWRGLRIERGRERAATQDVLGRYGVVAESGEMELSRLSGGNQQKVIIARWLELAPRVLLLDEPTQGVDVGARSAIHGLIRDAAQRGTSVLVASSDPRELAEVCDRVIGLSDGAISGEASGQEITPQRCLELAHGLVDPHTSNEGDSA